MMRKQYIITSLDEVYHVFLGIKLIYTREIIYVRI